MVRHQTQGAGSRSEKKCRAQTHCSHPPPRPVGSASRPQNSDVATQMRFACRSGCGGVCLPAYLDILTYHLRILRVSVTGCTLMHLVDHSVRDPLCVPLCYIHVHLLRANAVHPRQPVCIGQPVLSTCPVHPSFPSGLLPHLGASSPTSISSAKSLNGATSEDTIPGRQRGHVLTYPTPRAPMPSRCVQPRCSAIHARDRNSHHSIRLTNFVISGWSPLAAGVGA